LSISSYNGGISKTLKLFGKTPEIAIMRVNQLHPKQVYRTLRYEHQSDETRRYLEKVLKAKNRYRDLLDLNV
jgi:membrane-bound lytic murein transglycosylase C